MPSQIIASLLELSLSHLHIHVKKLGGVLPVQLFVASVLFFHGDRWEQERHGLGQLFAPSLPVLVLDYGGNCHLVEGYDSTVIVLG